MLKARPRIYYCHQNSEIRTRKCRWRRQRKKKKIWNMIPRYHLSKLFPALARKCRTTFLILRWSGLGHVLKQHGRLVALSRAQIVFSFSIFTLQFETSLAFNWRRIWLAQDQEYPRINRGKMSSFVWLWLAWHVRLWQCRGYFRNGASCLPCFTSPGNDLVMKIEPISGRLWQPTQPSHLRHQILSINPSKT